MYSTQPEGRDVETFAFQFLTFNNFHQGFGSSFRMNYLILAYLAPKITSFSKSQSQTRLAI